MVTDLCGWKDTFRVPLPSGAYLVLSPLTRPSPLAPAQVRYHLPSLRFLPHLLALPSSEPQGWPWECDTPLRRELVPHTDHVCLTHWAILCLQEQLLTETPDQTVSGPLPTP